MSVPFWIFIIFAIFVFSAWTYRYVIRPNIEKRRIIKKIYTPEIANAHHVFNQLYEGVDGKQIASADLKRLNLHNDAFVYGEIAFESFVLMLQFVKPTPEDIFYDLGCGTGKAVIVASLLFNFKKTKGIELLPSLYQLCEKQKNRLNKFQDVTSGVEFVHADILKTDFSDAGVVYINSTAFFGELWEEIVAKLCTLNEGARVILTSRELPAHSFQLLDERKRLMSWGMTTVRVYSRGS